MIIDLTLSATERLQNPVTGLTRARTQFSHHVTPVGLVLVYKQFNLFKKFIWSTKNLCRLSLLFL